MEISARIFGVNSWSILVPQALEGVAAVGLLYATVRRWFSPGAGLLAGAVLALTPVAALMFRFNNPDALLVLLLIGGRLRHGAGASRTAGARWLVLAGRAGRLRLPGQDAAGAPGRARPSASSTSSPRPTPLRRRIAQLLAGRRRHGRRRRLVGRDRRAHRRPPTGPTSAARRTTAL